MGKRVLGLDLGPNSIGWAIIDEAIPGTEARIIDAGVRVFAEGVDAYDSAKEKSRNEARRIARGMRRQTKRRVLRRKRLTQALIECGLFPSDLEEQEKLLSQNPYELRAKAIDPSAHLSLFQIGRVLLHLSRRRGFLSNRKTDKQSTEAVGMLQEIQQNEKERIESGEKTLGSWLNSKFNALDHKQRKTGDSIRGRHLSRQQYLNEFEEIWRAQSQRLPEIFTDTLKYGRLGNVNYPCIPKKSDGESNQSLLSLYGIYGLVFFQRKMYWKPSTIGRCELEPKEKRCPIGDRRFQYFRLLQEVNNLKFIDPESKQDTFLNSQQRKKVIDKLRSSEKLDFSQIRKLLGFPESVRFNLEKGERAKLKGNRTDAVLASKNSLGSSWRTFSEDKKNDIVQNLLDPNIDELEFIELAKKRWDLDDAQATKLLLAPLPTGYGALSLKAITKLTPFLEQGLIYSASKAEESALHSAGYLRRDQLRRRLFDFLPNPQRRKNTPIGNIPNPVVKRTLSEVRKLVNAILREYGKPDEIHVEMARDLQMGKLKRDEYNKTIRERERTRESIAKTLIEHGQRPSRENILRYQLWLEQRHECIYTGRIISQAQLWGEGGGIEVDHILPQSRTLDDSIQNKVLCFREANEEKGDRTPFEWLSGANPEKFEAIASRAMQLVRDNRMSYAKYKRIVQKELSTDDFVARQLVDTAYITKATAEYLRCLFDSDHHVLGLKGRLTAELRWQWGLETLLEELPDSPAWAEGTKLRPGEKNRADHRHHALDAIVIALTSRSTLQSLSNYIRKRPKDGELMPLPWKTFREDAKDRIARIWVSHRAERKVAGALHEESHYGKTKTDNVWVVRKAIESLSANEIESIRDPAIRKLVISKLQEAKIEFGRGKKLDPKKFAAAMAGLTMPSGVPIKKVRVTKPELTIRQIRESKSPTFVKPGSTHHLCIFESTNNGKKRRSAVFTPMLIAIQRSNRNEPIINRTHPDDAMQFVMSLSKRELVLVEVGDQQKLLVFRTAASTQGQLYFAEHCDARRKFKEYVFKANTLKGKKVTVDYLGRIRWAND